MKTGSEILLDLYFEAHHSMGSPSAIGRAGCGVAPGTPGVPPSHVQRLVDVGTAFGRLTAREKDHLWMRWIFRREADWWANMARNRTRGAEKRGAITAGLNKKEIFGLVGYYRREYRRIDRKKLTRDALAHFQKEYRRAKKAEKVGLYSEGL